MTRTSGAHRLETRFLSTLLSSVALAAAIACDAGSESPSGSDPDGSDGSGGATSSGGSSGTGGVTPNDGPPPPLPEDSDFTLLFRDDFDSLDTARWQLMTHSWDSNLALFSPDAVSVADGHLTISLLPSPEGTNDNGTPKPFLGAEVRSRDALTYGRVRARARLARGSAVISSLVTIYTPWPADNWNELDIECLGAEPHNVQFNAMVYTGPPTMPPVTTPVTPTMDPTQVDLGFDPSEDFHVYTIEWTPDAAYFLVDDELKHTWIKYIDLMNLPQNVLLTIWASNVAAWAGAVTEETGQATAVYDWVELYEYGGSQAP